MALAGLGLFVATCVLMQFLRPDLDWIASQMSLYLLEPRGRLLQAAYCAMAVAMVALALGLWRALVPAARSAAPTLLFALAAVALVVTAFAAMRLPDAPQTFENLVHGIAAQGAFLGATAGMVLQALRFRLDPHWRPTLVWALPGALAGFASVWALGLAGGLPRGLAQKAVIALIVAWMAAVALRLHRQARAAVSAPAPASRAGA
ncbi:DUF998 domain-containing protein [Coralloluteibacterium stylophorae]|uniref:DUF998 domain-containing protein n=1 Tax=Coralloluteibacterium stylophorae TaxID=1776034 RepID=A0A8J7VRY9_9GAMM|nr:DUF998 domain-containing protein [Coralloluteibacterium stylophorae]